MEEIERAVLAWGFDGIGGRRRGNGRMPRKEKHRVHLDAILRDLGPKEMLLLLAQLCEERIAWSRQKAARARSSQLRRAQFARLVPYYRACAEHFRRCADVAPDKSQ